MQTFITDYNFYKSAQNLDTKRLGAQIYEAIHILSSLTGCNGSLVNPKRDVSNHQAAKLWIDYEKYLLYYIYAHMDAWDNRYKIKSSSINAMNIDIIENHTGIRGPIRDIDGAIPCWINYKLIQTHRSVLIQKKPDHYKQLWPGCSGNIIMRYDWR